MKSGNLYTQSTIIGQKSEAILICIYPLLCSNMWYNLVDNSLPWGLLAWHRRTHDCPLAAQVDIGVHLDVEQGRRKGRWCALSRGGLVHGCHLLSNPTWPKEFAQGPWWRKSQNTSNKWWTTTQSTRSCRMLEVMKACRTLWRQNRSMALAAWIPWMSTCGSLCFATTRGGHQPLFRSTRALGLRIQAGRWRGRSCLMSELCRSIYGGCMYSGVLSGLGGQCLSRIDFCPSIRSTLATHLLGRKGMWSGRVCMLRLGRRWFCATWVAMIRSAT